jgi:hypothetical protein
MSERWKLPPDFTWDEDQDVPKHRASGKVGWISLFSRPPTQGEIDYLCNKIRFEYRRDRLFVAVGRDIARFRTAQIEMLARGYQI